MTKDKPEPALIHRSDLPAFLAFCRGQGYGVRIATDVMVKNGTIAQVRINGWWKNIHTVRDNDSHYGVTLHLQPVLYRWVNAQVRA